MFLPLLTLLLPALSLSATPPTQQQPQQPPSPPLYTATLHHLPVTTSPPSSLLSSLTLTPTPKDSPKPLAILTYSPLYPHLSTLTSFTPPPNSSDPDSLTQIAIYLPNGDTGSGRVRTSATATYAFHAPYRGRFRVVVDPSTGDVVAASYHAFLPPSSSQSPKSPSQPPSNSNSKSTTKAATKGAAKEVRGRGDFDILPIARAPGVVFDKAAKWKGSSNPFTAITGGGAGAGGTGEEGEEVGEKTFLQK